MKVGGGIKNDALTCKEWTNGEMIGCVDRILRKATSDFDCQLPMSMKIGMRTSVVNDRTIE